MFCDLTYVIGTVGLLPEWEDAPEIVPGTWQDCTGWQRDDPPVWVSIPE